MDYSKENTNMNPQQQNEKEAAIFAKNVAASAAADLAYSRWYAQLPNERKAAFFANGFKFVADKVRHEVKKENPFAGEEAVKLRFIEHTQKKDYPEETFNFIVEKMKERSEKEWQQRFKKMKKTLNWTHDDMARFIGASSGDSVKASVNRKLPAFAKLAVCVFEEMAAKIVA